MSTVSKVQVSLPWDISSVANYKSWAQGIGNALYTLGWRTAGDSGQVNWNNVTSLPSPAGISATQTWRGTWAGGTVYAAGDIVTYNGLTYQCTTAPSLTISGAVANTTLSFPGTVTACTTSGGSPITSTYTGSFPSGGSNAYVGYVFTITGFGSANNNGTFYCTASTTTTIVLANGNASAQSGQTASASSSSSNTGYTISGNPPAAAVSALYPNGAIYNASVIISGFSGSGAPNNNGGNPASILCSCVAGFGLAVSGVTITQAATATWNTSPDNDLYSSTSAQLHWIYYNYEIWVSQGPCSSTLPVYLKLVFGATTAANPAIWFASGISQVNGIVIANGITSATAVLVNGVQQGGTLYNCYFCGNSDRFASLLWKGTVVSSLFAIDRAHDTYGEDIDTFANAIMLRFGPYYSFTTHMKFGTSFSYTNWPCVYEGGSGSPLSATVNGNTPAFLLFPIVGYVANPCISAVYMLGGDTAEGSLVNVVVYNTSHTFLMTKSFNTVNVAGGIQWEGV